MESPPTPARHVVHDLPPEVQSLVQSQITRLEELRKQRGGQPGVQSYWDVLPDVLVGSDFIARALTGTPTLMDGLNTGETLPVSPRLMKSWRPCQRWPTAPLAWP